MLFQKLPGRNDPCWCGSGRKYKSCHSPMDVRLQYLASQGHEVPDHSLIKTPAQIEKIRASAKVNVAVLDAVEKQIRVGMPLSEIDRIVCEETAAQGAIAAPLNYNGYPYSVCTSVNDQVCHGYPHADVCLRSGDVINVDCSTILDGYFSDSSRMFCMGDVSDEKRRLVEVTKECVLKGLDAVKPWGFLGDVAEAVQTHAEKNGYSVVREIGGHGVGLEFHEDPWVGYIGKRGTGMVLAPGMIFTIEPMINMGKPDVCTHVENEWEIYTEDGQPSAQWELQVLVTETGAEVLSW